MNDRLEFNNNDSSVIIAFSKNLKDLPRTHMLTNIMVHNYHFGFYKNTPDWIIEKSSVFLYTGRSFYFPNEFHSSYKIVKEFSSLGIQHRFSNRRITSFFLPLKTIDIIKNHFGRGDPEFLVKCLYHDDKTPSLSVSITKGMFHCFSCKESGSLAKLEKKIKLNENSIKVKSNVF